MGSTNKSLREKVWQVTDNGLYVFAKWIPGFWENYKLGQNINLQSPFHSEKGTFSVFYNDTKGKWFFKDHVENGYYGDAFNLVARLWNLDVVSRFQHIANKLLEEMKSFDPPTFQTYTLKNEKTNEYIVFYKD